MKRVNKAKKSNFGEKLQKYDQFGQSFTFLIDEGRDALPSKIGAICSILLFVVVLAYTVYKISVLEGKTSIDILQAVKENHFDDSYVFGSKQGLNVAIAVTSLADPSPKLVDPTYGRIKFTKLQYEIAENGDFNYSLTEL